jgi:S1-C subfamily serine protease
MLRLNMKSVRLMVLVLALMLATVSFAAAQRDSVDSAPYLGLRVDTTADGVVILSVQPQSPAAEADLQVNDVITSVNGQAVTDASAVADLIRDLAPGDAVTLEVTRDNEPLTVEVTLGALGARAQGRGPRGAFQPFMLVQYDAEKSTWLIERLDESAPLYAAGLREGDVITAIDGETQDLAGLAALLRESDPETSHTLTVERGDTVLDVDVSTSDLHLLVMFGRGHGVMIAGMPGLGIENFPFPLMMGLNGRLGVAFETLDADIVTELALDVTEGAVIREVLPGTPAEAAGLEVNDVVTAVNNEPVDAERTLRDRLLAYEPGDIVTLTVERGGDTLSIDAELAEPAMPMIDHMSMSGPMFGRGMDGEPGWFHMPQVHPSPPGGA